MSDNVLATLIVAAAVTALLVFVLAPWRSLRRDALTGEDYYALLAGEEPPGHDVADEHEPDEDEPGPSAGDVAFP